MTTVVFYGPADTEVSPLSLSLPAVPRIGEFMRWRDGRVYRVKAVYWSLPGLDLTAEVMLEQTAA